MRLSAVVFLLYCLLRGVAMFFKPEKVIDMFPDQDLTPGTEAHTVAMAYARALADLIIACGALSFSGVKGRLFALAIIFPFFYVNHVVDELAFPPLVPVVAVNVIVLLLNLLEATFGGWYGKISYLCMQGMFGILFITEPAELVQDPFHYATEGTAALYVGQKMGFAVGFVLIMHAMMTLAAPPSGSLLAMLVVSLGMFKMSYVDHIPIPAAAIGAAAVCTVICFFDLAMGGAAEEKKKKE